MPFVWIVSIRNQSLPHRITLWGFPLVGACRALVSSHSYPKRFSKKLLLHFCWRGGPGSFEATGDGVSAYQFQKVFNQVPFLPFQQLPVLWQHTLEGSAARVFYQSCIRRRSMQLFLHHPWPCVQKFHEYLFAAAIGSGLPLEPSGFT